MNKVTIGLPRGIYYYYYGDMCKYFFDYLGFNVVISPATNRFIINEGIKYANDEMCLSLKILLGHVSYLQDKCDFLVVPRIDNFGKKDQTCTNFLAFYDIINNLFTINLLDFNIDYINLKTEKRAFMDMGRLLGINNKSTNNAYKKAKLRYNRDKRQAIFNNVDHLNSSRLKILIVGHPYNIYDDFIGKPVINILKNLNVEIIFCDKFNTDLTNKLSLHFSKTLYWKYSKENIGAINLVLNKVAGIIFLTSFPCGLDCLVNELVIRKISKPFLNLIIDDNDAFTGLETRLESFVDILEQVKN
ncbi:MAG: acyl-CoA dehydratase activase-related protein [Bacilli bacterium]